MSSDGMIFYYGDFNHPKGEVYPRVIEARPVANADGIRWATLHRMQLAGDLVSTNQQTLSTAQIGTRISELEDAYLFDYKDCGFKLSDGTPTPHKMETNDADNLSGNRVVHRSWDHLTPAEYASTRSFSVTIQALFREAYNEILSFNEYTTRIGTGGPVFRTFNLFNGTPVKVLTSAQSKVTHVTQGTVVGLTGWPVPPEPLWPEEEQEWRRVITQHSPRFHGDLDFVKGTHWRVDYTYYFERPGPSPIPSRTWFS